MLTLTGAPDLKVYDSLLTGGRRRLGGGASLGGIRLDSRLVSGRLARARPKRTHKGQSPHGLLMAANRSLTRSERVGTRYRF